MISVTIFQFIRKMISTRTKKRVFSQEYEKYGKIKGARKTKVSSQWIKNKMNKIRKNLKKKNTKIGENKAEMLDYLEGELIYSFETSYNRIFKKITFEDILQNLLFERFLEINKTMRKIKSKKFTIIQNGRIINILEMIIFALNREIVDEKKFFEDFMDILEAVELD
jgi:hypothetical protein